MSRRPMAVAALTGTLVLGLAAGALADTSTFYFHHSATPVTVPGGSTNFFLDETAPQSSGGGTQGFAAFDVSLDVTGERLILAGEAIAVTVSVMNNCNINLGYNLVYDGVGAQTRITFVSLDVGVAKCLEAVDK